MLTVECVLQHGGDGEGYDENASKNRTGEHTAVIQYATSKEECVIRGAPLATLASAFQADDYSKLCPLCTATSCLRLMRAR